MSVYYTKEHEWVRVEGDTATVGITDFAQGQLGDVVFVEVPEAGPRRSAKGGEAAVVESVKAASDVYAPVSGEVTEGNQALVDDPALVNSDPEGEGWFFKLTLGDHRELDEPDGRRRIQGLSATSASEPAMVNIASRWSPTDYAQQRRLRAGARRAALALARLRSRAS